MSSHLTVIDFHLLSHNWRTAYSYVDEDTPIGKGTMLLMLSERYYIFSAYFSILF